MTVLLLDDERDFKDAREAVVARSSDEAWEFVKDKEQIDELWLDFNLRGSDAATDFLWKLVARNREGNPLQVGKVYIHTSAYSAVDLLQRVLQLAGINESEPVDHREFFVTNR